MRRLPVLLVMLFAILWQSVAMAHVGSRVNVLVDLEHAALHWQGKSHHHSDDGSLQRDESNESAQHMAADHLSASLALAAPTSPELLPSGSDAPVGLHQAPVPNPLLDGLLRPPRSRA